MSRVHPALAPLAALAAALALPAVGRAQTSAVASTDPASRPPVRPVVAAVEDSALLVEPELWRNYQPGPGAGEPRLTMLIRVRTPNRRPLPAGVQVTRAWLTCASPACAGQRWVTTPRREEVPPFEPDAIEVIAHGGPTWAPGAAVDVTVELRDARGTSRRMNARVSAIRRLD